MDTQARQLPEPAAANRTLRNPGARDPASRTPPPKGGHGPSGGEGNSYGQILKSSALIGGSSVANIMIGIARTKIMAMLLGPSGVGLLGLYGAVFDLAQSVAGMGISNSGVRQIAEAAGSGEAERIARTAAVLRRTTVFLGALGAALLAAFSGPVSRATFGDDQHAPAIALLSAALFFRVVSDGQGALIQGMRRISDLAKMSVLGALLSVAVTIPLVYFLREQGIVPSLVGVAAAGLATSWWYSRKIRIRAPSMKASEARREQAALLKLGLVFMVSGLMMPGVAYLIRILLLREVGFEAAGLYQSAWALGGMYVGIVLQSMGTDFYPRLTAVAKDNAACNRMVNEQAEVSLLLAGPGVTATLVLAPIVISAFYTAQFQAAVEVLRWLCLGMALRIVSWPMGFIVLAKGEQGWFFGSELAWTAVYLGLAWTCVERYGLNGAGVAFFGSYVFHCLTAYLIARRLSGFAWSAANRKASLIHLPLIAIAFCGFYLLPYPAAAGVGIAATALSGVHSLGALLGLVSLDRLPRPARLLLERIRLVAAEAKGHADPAALTSPGAGMGRPLSSITTLTLAFMICAVFYMWVHWYGGIYGWNLGIDFPALKSSMAALSSLGLAR